MNEVGAWQLVRPLHIPSQHQLSLEDENDNVDKEYRPSEPSEQELSSSDEEELEDEEALRRRRKAYVPPIEDRRRWEAGMHTEVPEFHSSLQLEEFLDWICTTEEVLNFKGVPDNMKAIPVAAVLKESIALPVVLIVDNRLPPTQHRRTKLLIVELSALGVGKLATGSLSAIRQARRHYSQILMNAKRMMSTGRAGWQQQGELANSSREERSAGAGLAGLSAGERGNGCRSKEGRSDRWFRGRRSGCSRQCRNLAAGRVETGRAEGRREVAAAVMWQVAGWGRQHLATAKGLQTGLSGEGVQWPRGGAAVAVGKCGSGCWPGRRRRREWRGRIVQVVAGQNCMQTGWEQEERNGRLGLGCSDGLAWRMEEVK
ncbi:hypothetical protein MRB53_034531 [Persea americana]|uniref:Uncharacterized protein n=1 Tax=Persea americana TaxID=3435 RepID=A0ACC2K228_PERAE|nr:hypothetical protein MRB53_034531 [Persea americana]